MRIAKLLKKTEGLKQATKIELLFLLRVFSKLAYQPRFSLETARCALVANALRCEIAFSAIQKLKLFSLLKIKESLKSATKMALLILMRVFFKTRLFTAVFHFIAKRLFQQLPNLKIRSLLKIKEGLKTATKIALLFLMASFLQKLAYSLLFLTSLRNSVFSNSKVETFFIAEK